MKYPILLHQTTGEYVCVFNRAFNIHKTGQTITDDNGYQNLTFCMYYGDPKFDMLTNEMDVECDGEIYTIKKIEREKYGSDTAVVTCDAAWYKLADGEYKSHTSNNYYTALEAVQEQLEGTGWTIDSCDIETTHAYTLEENSVLTNLREIRDLYGGEMWFDTKNKKVLYGNDLGVKTNNILSYRKNLKGIKKTVDTTELYTRFTLIGQDGCKLSNLNGKLDYVENYSYYDDRGLPRVIKHYTKTDERFSNAFNMEEYMVAWLAIHSQPAVTYEVEAACLDDIPRVGDYVYVIDDDIGIKGWMKITEIDIDVLSTVDSVITLNNRILELTDALAEAEKNINAKVNVEMGKYTTTEQVNSAIKQSEDSVKLYADSKYTTKEYVNKTVNDLSIQRENILLGATLKSVSYWDITQGLYELNEGEILVKPSGDQCKMTNTCHVFADGDIFTISFYAKCPTDTAVMLRVGQEENLTEVVVSGTEYMRYNFMMEKDTTKTSTYYQNLVFYIPTDVYITKPMVEKGDQLSDFKYPQDDIVATVLEVENSSVKTVDVEYTLWTSKQYAPDNTAVWSTDAPPWEEGKYLWQRTKTVYVSGDVNYSTPACISGAAGADGVGIQSVVEQYYVSDSPTELVGGEWTETAPTWQSGKYIFTRSVITYTNGNQVTTDAICATGSQGPEGSTGPRGETGVSVEDTVMEYAQSDSATVEPTTGWSETPPAWEDGKFIWQRVVTHFSDGSSNVSGASCMTGSSGPKGDKGEQGISPTSIISQYYLSTSGTDCIGGEWTEDMPEFEDGKYLWMRNKISWEDGTTTYTDPILANTLNGQQQQIGALKVSVETINENMADLQVQTDSIVGEVSNINTTITEYRSDTDYKITEVENRVSTVEQTASEFSVTFSSYQSETDSRISDTEQVLADYQTYIKMTEAGIQIGRSDNEFNSLFSNDMLGFYQGTELKSYIDDEGLCVPNKATIGLECQVGGYAWVYDPETGHLTLQIK